MYVKKQFVTFLFYFITWNATKISVTCRMNVQHNSIYKGPKFWSHVNLYGTKLSIPCSFNTAPKFWPLVSLHTQPRSWLHCTTIEALVMCSIFMALKFWSCVHFIWRWIFQSLVNFLLNWVFDPLFTLYVTKISTTCSFCIGPRFHSLDHFICDQNFSSMLTYMEPKFWSHVWCN
jgi:hypothetical protein